MAIVGCGAIAHEHLSFLARDARIDLVGVCDLSAVTARYTAERFGARRGYTDLAELLADARPSVVHVLTPPATHARLARQVLAAGAHVIIEKPLTTSLSESRALLDEAEAAGLIAIESQNLRFNDEVLAIDALLADGVLGEVVAVEAAYFLDITASRFAAEFANPTRDLTGGAIHDFLPHLAYLALHFLSYQPLGRTAAFWSNRSANAYLGFDSLRALAQVGDGVAQICFDAHVKPEGLRLIVRGTRGSVETDLFTPYLRVDTPLGPKAVSGSLNSVRNGARLAGSGVSAFTKKVFQHTVYHGLHALLGRFYGALVSGDVPPISRTEVERSAELVAALLAEARP